MIQFNDLRITQNNKCLVIDVLIMDLDYFNKVTIDSIYIDTLKTFNSNGVSSLSILLYSQTNTTLDLIKDTKKRHIRLEITSPVINTTENNIYFIWVKANNTNAPESSNAPCVCNKSTVVKPVINKYSIYKLLLNASKELANNCDKFNVLGLKYLQYQAVESAFITGNYTKGIEYWNKFFKDDVTLNKSTSCGCNR